MSSGLEWIREEAGEQRKADMMGLLTHLWTSVRDGDCDALLVVGTVSGVSKSFSVGHRQDKAMALAYLVGREMQE